MIRAEKNNDSEVLELSWDRTSSDNSVYSLCDFIPGEGFVRLRSVLIGQASNFCFHETQVHSNGPGVTLFPPIWGYSSLLAAQIKVGYRMHILRKYEAACVTRDRWYPRGWDIGPTFWWAPPPRPSWTPDPMGTSTKGNLYTYIQAKWFVGFTAVSHNSTKLEKNSWGI